VPKNYLAFSPSSLKDLTRISNSPPSVWVDIFLSNRKNLLRDTEKFIKTLKGLEGFIRGAKRRKLFNFIKKINKKQKFFLKPGMFTS
jgi:prephenate dehydrogenase